MGFDRLAQACEAVDTAGARGAVHQGQAGWPGELLLGHVTEPDQCLPEQGHHLGRLRRSQQAAEMMALLRETLVRLGDMPEQEFAGPSGLALV
jgi:hypothetical protein